MHILCTICSDLVNQTESIYVTKCGHVFHHNCLAKWIARSKSCPQCRNKVTDRCMFRLYPTISNDNTGEDVTTLQSRLDNAQLQLHEQKTLYKKKEEQLANFEEELNKKQDLLKVCEANLRSREIAYAAVKDQLHYVQVENREMYRLKEENETLKKNVQTMNRLQKVLNATSEEVEVMLQGYSDVRTVATFATALKRALCESEAKKTEIRNRLQEVNLELALEKSTVTELRQKLREAKDHIHEYREQKSNDKKRDVVEAFGAGKEVEPDMKVQRTEPLEIKDNGNNASFTNLVSSIENSDSPYLRLKQSNLALATLQQRHPPQVSEPCLKPSEFGILNAARSSMFKRSIPSSTQKLSIFHKKEPAVVDFEKYERVSEFDVSYDGLGGHSKPSVFPVPQKTLVPKLSAKHKLKRPDTGGSHDISKMLGKLRDSNIL